MKSLPDKHRTRLLHRCLTVLSHFRWVAGALTLGAGIADRARLHWFGDQAAVIIALGAAVLLFNALFGLASRTALNHDDPAVRFRRLAVLASIALYFDIACITLIAAWTGDLHSPFIPLLVPHIILASLLLPRPRAFAAAAFAVVALCLPLLATGAPDRLAQEWILAAAWAIAIFAITTLASGIALALFRRERARIRQLERLKALSALLRTHQRSLIQSEKMVAVGQLAAGIAHEVNNPLSNIDSVLQLLQRRPEAPQPQTIAALREQVRRIERIVRQLNAFAHPGDGAFEVLPVNSVVRAALDMLALDKRLRGLDLRCDLDPRAGDARLNPHAMEQVLTNLIVNAIDATAQTPQPRIAISTRRDDHACIIEVADNGEGIPPDLLPRIFEPFFTTKPIGRGTGLGLPISARLVKDHNGALDVRSTPGEGTSFMVRIPLAPSSRTASAPSLNHEPMPHTPPLHSNHDTNNRGTQIAPLPPE